MPQPRDGKPRQRVLAAPAPGLCLDYANTRFWRGELQPTEGLKDFDALLHWLRQAQVVDDAAAASLGVLRTAEAAVARQLWVEALRARELIYRLFGALAAEGPPRAGAEVTAAAAGLSALIAQAPARTDLVFSGGQSGWRVLMVTPSAGELLAPVLWSAADLLLAFGRTRLRLCANPRCQWLFLDDSKGGTRRWCSMSACGNRAKVHRHFLRHSARARNVSES